MYKITVKEVTERYSRLILVDVTIELEIKVL